MPPIETEVEAISEPKPAVATPILTVEPPLPVVEPEPAPESQVPQPPADCTRLHTVNPNEKRLVQITDWFGLDLQTVATLNGLVPNAPLTAGWQICLPDAGAVPPPAAEPDLLPVDTGPPIVDFIPAPARSPRLAPQRHLCPSLGRHRPTSDPVLAVQGVPLQHLALAA